MNRTDRLMAIILLLRSCKKLTARQLAKTFEVSIRTIYRDIDSLCQTPTCPLQWSWDQRAATVFCKPIPYPRDVHPR